MRASQKFWTRELQLDELGRLYILHLQPSQVVLPVILLSYDDYPRLDPIMDK